MKPNRFTPLVFSFIFLFLFNSNIIAQGEIKVQLSGIAPEIEQEILPNDYIPSGFGLNNITLRLKNEGQRYWTASSSAIYKVKYNPATKHYDMGEGVYFTLKSDSEHYSLDKPMIIRINATTAFGNSIWTEVKRTRADLNHPLVLDQYDLIEGKQGTKPAYFFQARAKKFTPELTKTFLQGDVPMDGQPLTIKIKNSSSERYQSQTAGQIYGSKNGKFNIQVLYTQEMAPSQAIEGIISIKTVFGNYIWTEFKRNPDQIHEKYIIFDKYSGVAGDENAPLGTKLVKVEESMAVVEEKMIPETETTAESTQTASAEEAEKPKTTFTLKQQRGTLEIADLPQEIPSGNIKSTLLQDGSITVGQQSFSLKGDMPISYNMEKGYVVQAYANGNQKIETKYGMVTIKDGEPIQFSAYGPTGLILAEDAVLDTNYGAITVKANQEVNKNDLTFTNDGKLIMATLTNETSFEIGGETFNIAGNSVVKMSNDKIFQVQLSKEMPYEIAGLSVSLIPGEQKKPSLKFNLKTGKISQIYIANSSPVTTSDGPLQVNGNSVMRFDHDGTNYIVDRFEIGETKNLNFYRKNGKIKEKLAKQGKSIVMVDGKVRKMAF